MGHGPHTTISVAPKNKWGGVLLSVFASVGGLVYGYDSGNISGIKEMPDWLKTFGVTPPDGPIYLPSSTESLVVSILSAGTFFGALLVAPIADTIGRKKGLIMSCLVFSIGVALQVAATTIPLFVVGRFTAGLGVGLISCLVPMYQSETAPKWIRGAVVACYQWAITIGLLIAAISVNATKDRPNHSAWRLPIALQFIWAFLLAFGMVFLPESPRYYIKKGEDEKAAISLSRLVGASPHDPEIELELNDIRANLRAEEEMGDGSYAHCFKNGQNKILFRMLTGIALQAWQQLSGINFIIYYGTTFFKNSGIPDPFLITIVINLVNVVMTIPGIYLVDRAGRRRLLLVGAACMVVCEFLIAILGVTFPQSNLRAQNALIALVCLYIGAFACTWGPIAYVITGEIFPLAVRAKGMSMSIASNWLWNFVLSFSTPYIVNNDAGSAHLGPKVFFIWGSFCVGCFVFTYFCIPETKGLSLEQIDILYQNTTPIKSVAYRNQLIAEDLHQDDPEALARVNSRAALTRRHVSNIEGGRLDDPEAVNHLESNAGGEVDTPMQTESNVVWNDKTPAWSSLTRSGV